MANRLFTSLAAAALVAVSFASEPARAESIWACEALLHGGNPGGQMAQSETPAQPGGPLGSGTLQR